jgi:hypothetical protein
MDLHLKDGFCGDDYVPYVSLDPLKDPKSFTFRIKVKSEDSPIVRIHQYLSGMHLPKWACAT